eukprot:TRINITY_DN8637_c0_g1_i1.p1 TRINITY_DN8637_c0_g1~~TRINITY_DN8637_c0_g1_i1.p1  ORF type:complete len:685 (+),score=160.76 TRINITY_DN8637_c0_g1_i1:130-2184(+)
MKQFSGACLLAVAACTQSLLFVEAVSQQRLHVDRQGYLRVHARSEAERAAPDKDDMKHPIWRTSQPLFPVKINFDVSEMTASKGLTVVYDKGAQSLRIEQDMVVGLGGVAWGKFEDNIDTTGWSELRVMTSNDQNMANDVKMYAAGFIEGLMTSVRISQFYYNTQMLLLTKDKKTNSLPALRQLWKNQLNHARTWTNMQHHVFAEEPDDPYWKHARFMMFQMWGVLDGYNTAAAAFGSPTLELEDMMVLNAGGELPQLMEAYSAENRNRRALRSQAPGFLQTNATATLFEREKVKQNIKKHRSFLQQRAKLDKEEVAKEDQEVVEDPLDNAHWMKRVAQSGRCSALVRLADGDMDLFMGHTTWDDYSKMTRVFKYYNFSLPAAETSATQVAFSSYPGVISSTDDFYIMNSGIAVQETSLEMIDPLTWDRVLDFPAHGSIPNFMHLMIANRMAKSSPHWARLFSRVNTGTFTSQWMVIDYNQFTPAAPIPDGTFWVVEMMPGMTEMRDMSSFLRENRYFPSFNRPYFDKTREASGHKAAESSHGIIYSYTENPRAQIFRATASNANTLTDMRVIMTRNSYPLTGASVLDPGHEISARMDLSPILKIPNGGIDAKVVNRCLMKAHEVQAISGPSHAVQQPFRWRSADKSELWADFPHMGLPDLWNFSYVQITEWGSLATLSDITEC